MDGSTEANPKSKIGKKVTQKVEQNGKQDKENKRPDISFLTSYEGPNQVNYTAGPQITSFHYNVDNMP